MHSQAFAPLIDAHIHFDKYTVEEQQHMLQSFPDQQVEAVIAVSMNITSAQDNLELARQNPDSSIRLLAFIRNSLCHRRRIRTCSSTGLKSISDKR